MLEDLAWSETLPSPMQEELDGMLIIYDGNEYQY